jgi:hypothetical protein
MKATAGALMELMMISVMMTMMAVMQTVKRAMLGTTQRGVQGRVLAAEYKQA